MLKKRYISIIISLSLGLFSCKSNVSPVIPTNIPQGIIPSNPVVNTPLPTVQPSQPPINPTQTPSVDNSPIPEETGEPNPSETEENPTVSPTPTLSNSPIAVPSPTVSTTATPSSSPTTSPTSFPTISPTTSPTATIIPSPTPTVTITPTPTPTSTKTPSPYGNEQLQEIGLGKLNKPYAIAARNGMIFVTDIKPGGWFSSEKRIVNIFSFTGDFSSSFDTGVSSTEAFQSIALDVSNNIYLADKTGKFYKFTSGGTKLWEKTIGTADIKAIAIDKDNSVYVANSALSTVSKYSSELLNNDSNPLYFTGSAPISPNGLAVYTDSSNRSYIYIADLSTGKIFKYLNDGSKLLEFTGKGVNNKGPLFIGIGSIAADPRNGDLYVLAVTQNSETVICRYNKDGEFIHSFGQGLNAQALEGIAVDSTGTIYVVEKFQKVLLRFSPGRI